ncbi:phosphatase PAP2 family protein [Embleya sp. AB8]|uniref:phosphatase PAP2 family protein n=1 Tax=Embleya sp. AB8 TaxID=3156304 RepID=UPI003C75A4CF
MTARSGAAIDGGLYTDITDLARDAPSFLNTVIKDWTTYGLFAFAVLIVVAWWAARRQDARRMAQTLCAPLIVVAAFAVDDVIKLIVREERPCRTLHPSSTLEACPAANDWSFPSNHTVIAASAATVLLLLSRVLGALAALGTLAMAVSRVWVGAHYPHDVLVGLLVGIAVAWPLTLAAARAAPAIDRLRATSLRPLVAAGS